MFRVSIAIIRSTKTVTTASGIGHSNNIKTTFLQHDHLATLEEGCCSDTMTYTRGFSYSFMYSWEWVRWTPETCRVILQWINTCILLHLVGSYEYKKVTMHGTMNIKFTIFMCLVRFSNCATITSLYNTDWVFNNRKGVFSARYELGSLNIIQIKFRFQRVRSVLLS